MKFYLYLCMIGCVVDFIKSYRISKYRKYVDDKIEMIAAIINIFLPIYHLFMLISNLSIIFRSKEYIKLIAMKEDIEMLDIEK